MENIINLIHRKTEYEAPFLMENIIDLSYHAEFNQETGNAMELFFENRYIDYKLKQDLDEIAFFTWFLFDYKLGNDKNMGNIFTIKLFFMFFFM